MDGIISNIQRYSVHDGPGIRTTVFFKGCPMTCKWCHNPETQSYKVEVMHNSEKCTLCKSCESRCSEGAISFEGSSISYESDKCTMCEMCVDFCPASCIELVGKKMSSHELLAQIKKDMPFYHESGGGVTFSGGETMTQIELLHETILLCKSAGIHVAVDTCGYAPSMNFDKIADLVDLFLYDIKHMDSGIHKQYTGVGNDLIIENLSLIAKRSCEIQLRIPLIESFNADDKNIKATAEYAKYLGISAVSLLPYHSTGNYKYSRLRMGEGCLFEKPSDKALESIKNIFDEYGFDVKIGG